MMLLASDPEWLLSTTAQSAAALVAIIGGFLVSRVIAFSTERESLLRRRAELERARVLTQDDLQAVSTLIRAMARDEFREEALPVLVAGEGYLEPAQWIEAQGVPLGADESDVEDWVRELNTEVQQAFAQVRGVMKGGETGITQDELRARDVAVDSFPAGLLERVLEEIERQLEPFVIHKPGLYSWSRDVSNLAAPWKLENERSWRERLDRRQDLETRLRDLQSQTGLVSEQLAGLVTPVGVRAAVRVLVYFATVGVVLPLTLLALRPVPQQWWVRVCVVGFFVTGLAVLLLYMRNLIPKSPPNN